MSAAPPCAASPDRSRSPAEQARSRVYAALDLGTNNCRLLVAKPSPRGFRVIDAFSRIIRLGEGVGQTHSLSDAAIARTIEALQICTDKMASRGVTRRRIIATEACRIARNGTQFVDRVHRETGLSLEIVTRETEARLAVSGCASLLDPACDGALIFDIGGGSSEIVWLDYEGGPPDTPIQAQRMIKAWTSLPVGVVTLAEKFGGVHVTRDIFEQMVGSVASMLEPFERAHKLSDKLCNGNTHLLGTSGTVTTIAGVHLCLPRYDRSKVDGCWLSMEQINCVTNQLIDMSYDERCANPCIGADRADLVLAGCAIFEAIRRQWPCARLRVADRGLREGMLATMMAEDNVYGLNRRPGRGRRSRFHLRKKRHRPGS